jgi:hypothetical protein
MPYEWSLKNNATTIRRWCGKIIAAGGVEKSLPIANCALPIDSQDVFLWDLSSANQWAMRNWQ